MRANTFAGQVIAVLSRRTPAFELNPAEPQTFPGRMRALLSRSGRTDGASPTTNAGQVLADEESRTPDGDIAKPLAGQDVWIPVRLWIRALALATAVLLGVVVVSGAALVLLGLAFPVAVALAVAAGVLCFAFHLLYVATLLSGWFPSRARVRLLTALWVSMIVVLASGGLAAVTRAPLPLVVMSALVVGGAVAPLVRRSIRRIDDRIAAAAAAPVAGRH